MQIGIAGAGAIGCHYGSLLQQAGHDVICLARGAHLAALQQHGLKHESNGRIFTIPLRASDDPAALSDCEALLLCCKMTSLDALLLQLRGHIRNDALLLTLQNGVEAPDLAAERFPEHPVIAGTAFIGARIEAPGHVVHSAAGGIRLAAWRCRESAVDAMLAALNQAGIPARREQDAQRMLWRKLLWNVGFNALTAITRRYAHEIAAADATLALVCAAMRETVALAQSLNIALGEEDIAKHIEVTLKMGPVKTSMWQDIEAGRPTEIDHINGYVAEKSKARSLPAPVNEMLTAIVRAIEHRI